MRDRDPNTELDLIPILNLVTILIPFLLLSAQFVQISAVEVDPPGMADPTPPKEEVLGLRVRITELGFEVSATPSALQEPVELGCVGGFCTSATAWDTRGLNELLVGLKRDWPADRGMILEPASGIPYEVVVAALDASRATATGQELFPSVAIAGGM